MKSLDDRVAALPGRIRRAALHALRIARERDDYVRLDDVLQATTPAHPAVRAAVYGLFGYTPLDEDGRSVARAIPNPLKPRRSRRLGIDTPLVRECIGIRCAVNRRAVKQLGSSQEL